MISCEKASLICNKTQYKEASFIEKLKLRFHLVLCKTCSKFASDNKKLTALCERADLHGLSEKEKVHMKRQLEQKI